MVAPTQLTAVVDARDGGAEFRELALPREHAEIAAGMPPVQITAPMQALAVSLLESADGGKDESDPHPVERAQLVVVLGGRFEIDTGTEARPFGPGDLLLAADTAGRGHVTRILERPTKCVFVALDPDAVARLLARR
jgi:hypothetical protein